jgi:putative inorganic carbon (HCO3(-)) transporter
MNMLDSVRDTSRHGQLLRQLIRLGIVAGVLLTSAALPRIFAFVSPRMFIMLAVGVAFLLLAIRYPHLTLLLLLCYGPFASGLRFAGLGMFGALLKDIFALLLVVLWLVRWMLKQEEWKRTPLDLPVVLFTVLAAVQALRGPSLLRGIAGLKVVATYIPVYFWVTNNPPDRKQIKVLMWAMLATATVVALYGVFQYRMSLTSPEAILVGIGEEKVVAPRREGQLQVLSTLGHSSLLSLYLSLMITLALAWDMCVSQGKRWLLWFIMILFVGVMLLTVSRSGWVGTVMGLVTLVLLWPSRQGRIRLVLGLLIVGLLVSPLLNPAVKRTMNWSFTKGDVSFTNRRELIKWAYIMIFREIPEGCGLGHLSDSAHLASLLTGRAEPDYTCTWHGYSVTGADTVALALGVQMGVTGFLLFTWITVGSWIYGFLAYRCLEDPFLKGIAVGLLAYMAIMAYSNYFAGSLQGYPVVNLYFWFFMGLLMSLKRIPRQFQERAGQEM